MISLLDRSDPLPYLELELSEREKAARLERRKDRHAKRKRLDDFEELVSSFPDGRFLPTRFRIGGKLYAIRTGDAYELVKF